MYKNIALFNGVMLALMVFVSGMLSSQLGPYISTFIFHIVGLIFVLSISVFKKNKYAKWHKIPPLFYLPGILSVITLLFNNITVPNIGISLSIGISLLGQLIMSSLVDHFGLFHMPKISFHKEKIFGFLIILIGIIVMILV